MRLIRVKGRTRLRYKVTGFPPGSQLPAPALPSAVALAAFEGLCLLGNTERPQFLQLEYFQKTFALYSELIESVLMNYHQLFRKVCLSFPLPNQDLYANWRPQITLMSTAFQVHTLITTPPLPPVLQNTPSTPLSHFSFMATALYCPLLKQFCSELETENPHTTHQTHYRRD